jgi:hypothetical protein
MRGLHDSHARRELHPIYAAALGSEGLDLPPGVALKLPKGSYLNLGLHLYNTSAEPLEGVSGMEIVRMAAADVKFEAEAALAGTFDINIPPGRHTLSGDCKIAADQSVFALFPHMHQYGVHLKTTFTVDGVSTVVHDAPFQFAEQHQIPLHPVVSFHAGDVVSTDCTYENGTANTIKFGESSSTEMCFSVLFRYPRQSLGICATRTGGGTPLPGPACAKDGAVGNDVGVGRQCSKGGKECTQNGVAAMCLADFTAGAFGNFCSTTCKTDGECGADAACQGTGSQRVCIPTACPLPVPSDGGTAGSPRDGG